MKTEKNILIAFILNLIFSLFEFFGGVFTNSIAIISDAIHDLGDALSIGVSYFLERKSKKKPNNEYTYGYIRYSLLGAFITTVILVSGCIFVIYSSIKRLFVPEVINYNGMIIIAIIGFVINLGAATLTKDGDSLNQKAVNLHMLEDVLGWAAVLVSSILIKFTKLPLFDTLASLGVAIFILIGALKNLKNITDLFLDKVPKDIDVTEILELVKEIPGVIDVHHIHLWSLDGNSNYATMHIITDSKNQSLLKEEIKNELKEHGIAHTTIEIENKKEKCQEHECNIKLDNNLHHHHHY